VTAARDVIGIGENSVDYVYRLPEIPSPNGKVRILGQRISPGGQVATTLCACARLGLRASYVGTFGDDGNGTLIRSEMERRGVHTGEALTRRAPNRYAVVLVDGRTAGRAVLWDRDPALALRPDDLRPEVLANARLLHVDGLDEDGSIAAARIARQAGVRVTTDLDAVTPRTADLLDLADVAILAEHVPGLLTGESAMERALAAARRHPDQWVCVTLGDRGAALLAGARVYQQPAFQVRAVDTTGAGDVFRAGFIDALLRGAPPEAILRFANAAAAVSCTREGAIDSVPSREEIEALLNA
jgi:sugar/nucleoside kinase (ribokinase family)